MTHTQEGRPWWGAINWTPEPWDPYPDTSVRFVELRLEDYRRAVACVNALSGLNPEGVAEAVAALEKIDKHAAGDKPYNQLGAVRCLVAAALAKLRGGAS
jgi:hypothetical protein